MKLLLTGASGFLGGALLRYFSSQHCLHLYPVYRGKPPVSAKMPSGNINPLFVNEFFESYSWQSELVNIDVIVHAAGLAHLQDGDDQLAEFRRVNVEATLNLARRAASCGVKRFVFISSIGVNGSGGDVPYTEQDSPRPTAAYAVSKYEAELALLELARLVSMEVVIIRPPLIYGPGAPGNFGRLVKAVGSGIPLPFGSIQNKRTSVGIDNLLDLINVCVNHPLAANQIFLAGDGEDISTATMLRIIGEGLGKSARLINVPAPLLYALIGLLGKRKLLDKICGNLQVDISKAKNILSWTPATSVREGLLKAVAKEKN